MFTSLIKFGKNPCYPLLESSCYEENNKRSVDNKFALTFWE
jgi:hypothetical protein